ncbi:TonB-dependent receptor [soil metagenome]
MTMRMIRALLLGTGAYCALALPSIVSAQTGGTAVQADAAGGAADAASASDLETIVVTARRRAENIQSVPVSITAFSAETLAVKGIQSTADVQRIVPCVIFVGAGSAANSTFTIRGQSKDVVGPGLPSVITYFNEVPMPSWGSVLPTYDVSSVQVLKGPQGTLFGRNTTGGAVLVYSAPATDRFEGYVQLTAGDYFWRGAQGAVNIPIAEGVALRLAGDYQKRDGYVREIGIGGDGADLDSTSFRATLKLEPTANITNVTVFDYYRQNTNMDGYIAIDSVPNPIYRFIPGFNCRTSPSCDVDLAIAQNLKNGLRTTNSNTPHFDRTGVWGVSNTTTINLGSLTLKNIFGYRDTNVKQQQSTDGLPLALLDTRGFRVDRQITDEIQLSGSLFDNRLQYLLGAFYLDLKPTGPDAFAINVFDATGTPDTNPFASIGNNLYSDRSKAVFGNISFEVVKGLKVNAGVRKTWDRESVCAVQTQPYSAEPIQSLDACRKAPGFFESSVKFDAWTYTLGADYQITDRIFSYVTVRKGYRAGGINPPALGGLLTPFQFYGPQVVNDVELGVKTQWNVGEARGRFNIAVFQGKFKDLQRQLAGLVPNLDGDNNPLTDPSGTALIINGARARVQGVEVDGLFQPVPSLTINYGLSYLDAKYTSTTTPAVFVGQTGTLDRFPKAPKWSYTVAGRYELPFQVGGAKFYLNADFYHLGPYLSGVVNVPGYDLANANLQIDNIGGTPLSATVFVTNIADKAYLQNSNLNGSSPGVVSFSIGEPRMYGVRLRYNF